MLCACAVAMSRNLRFRAKNFLILFPILGSDSCKIPIESIDRILWIESISDIVLNI